MSKIMIANQIKVRRKETVTQRGSHFYIYISLGIALTLGAAAILAVTTFSDRFNFAAPLEVVAEGKRQIIRVPKGGDLQAAIGRAQSGDTIELQAGATYYGEIKLPNKPLTDYVTIQTSAAAQLPEDKRVSPANANLMAKIVTKGGGVSAVSTANGANHYRFVGIEFAPDNGDYIYNLVYFGDAEEKANVPHDLEIDRCYLHPNKAGITRRGLAVNSANTTVKNSYFEGFAFPQQETQAIAGWTGTKNVKILNNHLEGGAENVLFGGSDPKSPDLIPADIEVRGNYISKPAAWKTTVTNKCLFELKNAKRVEFVGNYLENNWVGSAFRVTVRNQDGAAPFSTIEDVTIKDNVIDGAGEGINILGRDDTYPSQTLKRLTITNNLFLNIGGTDWAGSGYFIQISGGEDISIAHNTVFNGGNTTSFYNDMPKGFLFRDNIVGHSDYGIHGHPNIKSADGQRLFQNNVIVDNKRIDPSGYSFPSGNFLIKDYDAIGFINFAQKDFRLAPTSRFKGKGVEKTDVGANVNFADFQKIKAE